MLRREGQALRQLVFCCFRWISANTGKGFRGALPYGVSDNLVSCESHYCHEVMERWRAESVETFDADGGSVAELGSILLGELTMLASMSD